MPICRYFVLRNTNTLKNLVVIIIFVIASFFVQFSRIWKSIEQLHQPVKTWLRYTNEQFHLISYSSNDLCYTKLICFAVMYRIDNRNQTIDFTIFSNYDSDQRSGICRDPRILKISKKFRKNKPFLKLHYSYGGSC